MAANDVPCCEPMFWVYLVICVALVLFAGLMSGLTLGLMSLSMVDLEILTKAGQPHEQKNAAKILPIVKNQHLLLCTLLIGNSLAMEALPIFTDALLPAWGAILISVTLILAFGEIIPQAVCSRYGLNVGAKLSILVRFIVIVLFPLAYPISKLLDLLLGKRHSALLCRAELRTLVDMHANEAGKGGELTHDETTIITGALGMTQKTAKDAMTPLLKVFSLEMNAKLDEETMGLIISKGHSRVPIYYGGGTNIIGLILVKNLIKCCPEDGTPIRDLTIRSIPRVRDHLPLYDILNQFQNGHSHMAIVVKYKNEVEKATDIGKSKPWIVDKNVQSNCKLKQNGSKGNNHDISCVYNQTPISMKWERSVGIRTTENLESTPPSDEEVLGIITLEDVMEELLQEEIWDETDEYVDIHNSLRISMQPSRSSPFRSPGRAISSPGSMRSPTPTLHSPVSRYSQSPKLSASPMPKSPLSGASYSPSTQQVSRKWYEKLGKAQDS